MENGDGYAKRNCPKVRKRTQLHTKLSFLSPWGQFRRGRNRPFIHLMLTTKFPTKSKKIISLSKNFIIFMQKISEISKIFYKITAKF